MRRWWLRRRLRKLERELASTEQRFVVTKRYYNLSDGSTRRWNDKIAQIRVEIDLLNMRLNPLAPARLCLKDGDKASEPNPTYLDWMI